MKPAARAAVVAAVCILTPPMCAVCYGPDLALRLLAVVVVQIFEPRVGLRQALQAVSDEAACSCGRYETDEGCNRTGLGRGLVGSEFPSSPQGFAGVPTNAPSDQDTLVTSSSARPSTSSGQRLAASVQPPLTLKRGRCGAPTGPREARGAKPLLRLATSACNGFSSGMRSLQQQTCRRMRIRHFSAASSLGRRGLVVAMPSGQVVGEGGEGGCGAATSRTMVAGVLSISRRRPVREVMWGRRRPGPAGPFGGRGIPASAGMGP
jgi:hypothetical protein